MMKKLLALLLASMLLLAFVACGGDEKASESASESQSESESESESDSQVIEKPTTGDEGWTNPAGGK